MGFELCVSNSKAHTIKSSRATGGMNWLQGLHVSNIKKNAIVLCACTADHDIDHGFTTIIFKTNVLKPFLSYLMEITRNSP